MEKFCRLIVKRELDCWVASFKGVPEHRSSGQSVIDSIANLMESLELPDLSMVQSVSVEDETTEDSLEISAAGMEVSR